MFGLFPAIPFPGTYPEEMKAYVHKKPLTACFLPGSITIRSPDTSWRDFLNKLLKSHLLNTLEWLPIPLRRNYQVPAWPGKRRHHWFSTLAAGTKPVGTSGAWAPPQSKWIRTSGGQHHKVCKAAQESLTSPRLARPGQHDLALVLPLYLLLLSHSVL